MGLEHKPEFTILNHYEYILYRWNHKTVEYKKGFDVVIEQIFLGVVGPYTLYNWCVW